VKRGEGEKGRAKATIRYIQHRRDRNGERVNRTLFGYDGALTREQAYRMIDEARNRTIFYRIVLSPAPAKEDRLRDLNLTDLTISTMLELEERLGKQIQFVATIHDDHSPHRHVHTLVLVEGKRLTKEDFQALREKTTEQALSQRRLRDRGRAHQLSIKRARTFRFQRHVTRGLTEARQGRIKGSLAPWQGYLCLLCGYYQALPPARNGHRCPTCGLYLRRDRNGYGLDLARSRERGYGLELSLSP
jgi:rubrerythrin